MEGQQRPSGGREEAIRIRVLWVDTTASTFHDSEPMVVHPRTSVRDLLHMVPYRNGHFIIIIDNKIVPSFRLI